MESYEVKVPHTSTFVYKDGRVVTGSATGNDYVKLVVVAQNLQGDHKSPNSFEFFKRSSECLRGTLINSSAASSMVQHSGYFQTVHFGTPIELGDPLASGFTNSYNDALSQIYSGNARADGLRGNVDLTIDGFQLGLLRKTIIKIAKGFSTLGQSYNRIKKHYQRSARLGFHSKADGAAMAAKEFGSYYLEWWYGIRPTLMTAQELAKELQAGLENAKVHKVYRSRARRVVVSSFTGGWNEKITNKQWGYRVRSETSYRTEIKVRLRSRSNDLQELARFVSLNPAAWAYELTPWSFVLDWFWNFGGYMRNLETCLVYADKFVDGYVTNTAKRTAAIESMTSSPPGCIWSRSAGGKGSAVYLKRTPLSSLPSPKIPRLDPQLGSKRLIAAAALLSQSLGRKLPFQVRPSRIPGGRPSVWFDPLYFN